MDIKSAIKKLDIEVKAQLLTGSDFWNTVPCPYIGLDKVALSDGPNGLRIQNKRSDHLGIGASRKATCFPTAATMACSWDVDLCQELGKFLGAEAAYHGISMVLGPGLNIKRSPLCGRNFEYFSEDSYLSGKLSAAYVRGVQSFGVTSCLKHFAVNCRELGRMVYDCVIDERTLRETYLTGFEIAVKEGGAGAVMSAYNKVNGVYCNENTHLIGDILRGEWRFNGVVVSDWGAGRDSVSAVKAGADLEMPQCKFSAKPIIQAVKDGSLREDLVDNCVERLYNFVDRSKRIVRAPFSQYEHDLFAQKCEENCLVLLKNANNALPLNDGERVALIGDFAETPRYQGAGSSSVNPTSINNILHSIKNSSLNFVGFKRGFKRFGGDSNKLLKKAVKLALRADTVVVCLGLDEDSETESLDRQDIFIPHNQITLLTALAKLHKKIIVVLSCGSVVDMSWDGMADGIIHAYLGGQSSGSAVVNALIGKVNPSGRLAESYPLALKDVPCTQEYFEDSYKINFKEKIYVGYKHYNTFNIAVKYPFGFGLSYTNFSFKGFNIDVNGVSFNVKNTGNRDGATVAQIYVKVPDNDGMISPNELKGFAKIFLAANEEKQVHICFDDYTFRMWNTQKNCWCVGGNYVVSLAENSRDMLFSQTINITENNYIAPEGYIFNDYSVEGDIIDDNPAQTQIVAENNITDEQDNSFNVQPSTKNNAHSTKKDKVRVVADFNTEVSDLLYCKGVVGKIFGIVSRIYSHSRNKMLASSMNYLPLRTLLQFIKLDEIQAEGFIEACNGAFLKGMKKLIFKKR